MSEEYITPAASARNTSGGGARNRPDTPRTVVMVLSKKPVMLTGEDGKAKGIKIGFSPNREERAAANGSLGRYDRVGKWANEVAVFEGQLLSPVAGRTPGFADADSIPEADKNKGVILNGEMYYPTGDNVQVQLVVGKNAQKLASFKVGGVAVLEDVSLRAPALPTAKGTDIQNALVPVPNDKANLKGATLLACSDRARSGFFHIGPNAKTADERLSFLGHTMLMPTPWEAKKRESDPANAAPIMMGGINGAMGVVVDVASAYQVENVEAVAQCVDQWQDYLKEQNSSAYAGAIVQLFRKPVAAKTGEVMDDAQAQAMFEKMRGAGLEPQQAFTLVANDVKDTATGEWHPRRASEALKAVLDNQERNVALMHARMEDGTNTSSIKAMSLRSLMDGGLWSIVVVPVHAWNVSKSIKDNVASGRFDPLENWRSLVALPGQRKVSEKGNVVSYDPLMAHANVFTGKVGSFKPAEGQPAKDTVFAGVPGIRQGYMEVLQVEGGHTMVDARPMDKAGEVAVPPRLLITEFTPVEHVADMQAQAAQLAANARAVEFGSTVRRSAPAQQPTEQPASEQPAADEPSGPRP